MAVVAVEARHGRDVVETLVVEHPVRPRVQHFLELLAAHIDPLGAPEAHRYQAFGVDVEQLGDSLVAVAGMHVVVPVRVFHRQADEIPAEALGRTVRPNELGEEHDLYA